MFIILRPRPRTYASTSPLLLLQLHQQQQLLSINIINCTNHLQHTKLRILLQHLTSHAAYERSCGPPKRPAAKRPCIYIQGSPSGCVRREIPGVTQVDEKGHEGNTAVVTAFNIYVGGNMVKETARQEEFLLTTTVHFEKCY